MLIGRACCDRVGPKRCILTKPDGRSTPVDRVYATRGPRSPTAKQLISWMTRIDDELYPDTRASGNTAGACFFLRVL